MKSYRGGHLVRRIRRRLEQAGYPAEVSILTKPEWHPTTTDNLIETRIEIDGETHVLHHPAKMPTPQDKVEAIIARTMEIGGVPMSEVQKRLDQCGHSLRAEEGFLAIDRWSCDPMIVIPTSMVDVMRRRWETVMSFPHPCGQPLPGDYSLPDSMHTHIECDRKRRLPNGMIKRIRIGGLFAAFLREREDAESILMRVVPLLEDALDATDKGDAGSVITVERVTSGIPDLGMKWTIKGNHVHLKEYDRPQWSIDADTLLLKQALPQTVVDGLPGKLLGDVVEGLPFASHRMILQAKLRRSPWSGVALKISARAVSVDELMAEIKGERARAATSPDETNEAQVSPEKGKDI